MHTRTPRRGTYRVRNRNHAGGTPPYATQALVQAYPRGWIGRFVHRAYTVSSYSKLGPCGWRSIMTWGLGQPGGAMGGGRPAMAATRPVSHRWEAVVVQGDAGRGRWRGAALGAAAAALLGAIVAVAATGRGGRPAHYFLLQAPPAMGLTSLALRGGDRKLVVAEQMRLQQQARLLKSLQSEDARLMRLDALPQIVQDMPTGGKVCVDKGGNQMRATM